MKNNAPNSVSAASPWRRVGAYLVDYVLVILPLLGLICLGAWWLNSIDISLFTDSPWQNQGVVILLLTIPVVCYFALSEASRFQATLGKRLMRLMVVGTDGHRATLKQTTIRAVVKFLPWEYFHTLLWHWEGWPTNPAPPTTLQIVAMTFGWIVIGWFLCSLMFGSRRTPYDRLAGTAVTNGRSLPNNAEM